MAGIAAATILGCAFVPSIGMGADPKASADITWFTARFGASTWEYPGKFTLETFSIDEYRRLIDAAAERSYDGVALTALMLTLLPHLREHPGDPKYAELARTLHSFEYVKRVHDVRLVGAMPARWFTKPRVLALVREKAVGPWVYPHLPAKYQQDSAVVEAVVAAGGVYFYPSFPARLQHDRAFALRCLDRGGWVLGSMPYEFKADRELVTRAARRDCSALQHAADELRADPEFVRSLARREPCVLLHASEELQNAPEFLVLFSRTACQGESRCWSEY